MHPQLKDINNEFNRFEAVFNHASMGIVIVNNKGIIESVNFLRIETFWLFAGRNY